MHQFDYNSGSKAPRKSSMASTRSHDDREDARTAGRWTREEHQKFVEGLKKFGKNWKAVEEFVGTRSGAQVRSHAQKFFNKLEKEFNIKFENLNLEEQKAKFEETLRKMSDQHYGGASSTEKEEVIPELQIAKKIEKTLSPVPEFSVSAETLTQNSVQSKAISQSNSPKLNHFDTSAYNRRAPRKMSEDVLSGERNYSLFDLIMSKIRSANNRIIIPTLSDLVDLTSSTRSSFDESHMHFEPVKKIQEVHSFSNTSFRMNPRKMSEDHILMRLTEQSRRPDARVFDDCEPLVKKLHANY